MFLNINLAQSGISHNNANEGSIAIGSSIYTHLERKAGLPSGSDCEESVCNVGDLSLIPGLRRFPGEGKGYPLQYSCWRIPWTEKPSGLYSPWDCIELDTTQWLSLTHTERKAGLKIIPFCMIPFLQISTDNTIMFFRDAFSLDKTLKEQNHQSRNPGGS